MSCKTCTGFLICSFCRDNPLPSSHVIRTCQDASLTPSIPASTGISSHVRPSNKRFAPGCRTRRFPFPDQFCLHLRERMRILQSPAYSVSHLTSPQEGGINLLKRYYSSDVVAVLATATMASSFSFTSGSIMSRGTNRASSWKFFLSITMIGKLLPLLILGTMDFMAEITKHLSSSTFTDTDVYGARIKPVFVCCEP